MSPVDQKKDMCAKRNAIRLPSSATACLLVRGGALGVTELASYERCGIAGIHPDWERHLSIGPSFAIIAGTRLKSGVEGLRRFWKGITSDVFGSWTQDSLTLEEGTWSEDS